MQRITSLAGTAFLILILVIVGWIGYLIRSPMTLAHGRVEVDGLAGSVEIYRDDWGVPHIYADTTEALFFA